MLKKLTFTLFLSLLFFLAVSGEKKDKKKTVVPPPLTTPPETAPPIVVTTPTPTETPPPIIETTPPPTKKPKRKHRKHGKKHKKHPTPTPTPETPPPIEDICTNYTDIWPDFEIESYVRSIFLPQVDTIIEDAYYSCYLDISVDIPSTYEFIVTIFVDDEVIYTQNYTNVGSIGRINLDPIVDDEEVIINYFLRNLDGELDFELCDVVRYSAFICEIVCPDGPTATPEVCPQDPNPYTGQGYTQYDAYCLLEGGEFCIENTGCRLCTNPVTQEVDDIEPTQDIFPPVCERYQDQCLSGDDPSCCASDNCQDLCEGFEGCCAVCVNLGQEGRGCQLGSLTEDGCNLNDLSPIVSRNCSCDDDDDSEDIVDDDDKDDYKDDKDDRDDIDDDRDDIDDDRDDIDDDRDDIDDDNDDNDDN